MATTHGPSENNYLAGTSGNDQIYGYESNDTIKANATTKKVLILQSLVCNSTAAGGGSPDQISLKVQNQTVWNNPSMNAGFQANLHCNQDFHSKVDIELFVGFTSLGRETVSNSGDSPLPFTKGQASYTLTYLIS